MNINNYTFRDLYRSFTITKSKMALDWFAEIMDVPERCDSVFSYCYIDSEAGMTFDCLHPAVFDTEEVVQRSAIEHVYKIRAGYYRNNESPMKIIHGSEKVLTPVFAEYVQFIDTNYSNEDIEGVRELVNLDGLREPDFPDDIKTIIYKEGMEPEQVWVRTIRPNKLFITEEKALDILNKGAFGANPPKLEDLVGSTYMDRRIHGILLNEPNQDFGVHDGDAVVIVPQQLGDNMLAIIDFRPFVETIV